MFAIGDAVHEATCYSHFELMFGMIISGPIAMLKTFTGKKVENTQVKYHEYIDKLTDKLKTSKELSRTNIKACKLKMEQFYNKRAKEIYQCK